MNATDSTGTPVVEDRAPFRGWETWYRVTGDLRGGSGAEVRVGDARQRWPRCHA